MEVPSYTTTTAEETSIFHLRKCTPCRFFVAFHVLIIRTPVSPFSVIAQAPTQDGLFIYRSYSPGLSVNIESVTFANLKEPLQVYGNSYVLRMCPVRSIRIRALPADVIRSRRQFLPRNSVSRKYNHGQCCRYHCSTLWYLSLEPIRCLYWKCSPRQPSCLV